MIPSLKQEIPTCYLLRGSQSHWKLHVIHYPARITAGACSSLPGPYSHWELLVNYYCVHVTTDTDLFFTACSTESLRISNSLARLYYHKHLPVPHCPVPRATAKLPQPPPFYFFSRTMSVIRGRNIMRWDLWRMAEQLAQKPCASLGRHQGSRLPWYQSMQTLTCYILWILCTWGQQVRPQTPVWNKYNNVAKRSFVYIL